MIFRNIVKKLCNIYYKLYILFSTILTHFKLFLFPVFTVLDFKVSRATRPDRRTRERRCFRLILDRNRGC